MFTGIIQSIGHVLTIKSYSGDLRITIAVGALDMTKVHLGDSIAVNGVCLTVVNFDTSAFSADISQESIKKTALAQLKSGHRVNLEKALLVGDPLGGHYVSGHVDGVGTVVERKPLARAQCFRIQTPQNLLRYIAKKGSVTVNGVSLTVNDLHEDGFEITCVPHTLEQTTLQSLSAGDTVNLEIDLLARYMERLLSHSDLLLHSNTCQNKDSGSGVTPVFLTEHGFMSSDDK